MIISKIIGGLGNQMFQYAVGRALAIQYEQSLRLDVSWFVNYKAHQGFELQRIFNNIAEISTEAEVLSILGWQFPSGVRRIVRRPRMAIFRRNSFIIEPHFHYWPGVKNIPKNSYLEGYWQSDKYFQDVTEVIRNDFRFKLPLSSQNNIIAKQIGAVDAVSLHVRRGDYVKNHQVNATHGLCPIDYYQAAIRYISERVQSPYFFIFSDDMDWVKDKFKIDFPCQYIEQNQGAESYNDMRLMSLCQHHIIANSSFSWWGAWLNPNTKKIVITPQNWLATDDNTSDITPENWIKI